MSEGNVTIFAENKILPTKDGFESFTSRPVLILDGTVTNIVQVKKPREVILENTTKISRK